jgi:tetratricopeptide (TPR) repeat protein
VSEDERCAADRSAHERGSCVGRYVILEHLHSGGMGAVYRAFDPNLNRPVALKLVSARLEGDQGGVFRDRLLREAQGLARLSHPNVVGIYDVGVIDGDVFLAMELVEGQTLRRWLAGKPRRRPLLEVFAAAAEGLAAAHRAELVHRDVKPDNILIGDDGRVRVVDFGLVRPVDEPPSEAPVVAVSSTVTGESSSAPTNPLFSPLTEAGALLGTPTYMAPEQFAGGEIGPATDQFGLCVSLYEALCGKLPFDGASVEAIRRHVCGGRYQSPPTEARVPARLRRLLARGLASDPARRFGSMAELAAELRRDPAARWRRGLALAAAAVGIAAAAAVVARAPAAEVCARAEHDRVPVWGPGTRAAVQVAFAATGRGHAGATFDRVDAALTVFDRAWAAQRQDACEATHVRGEQSAHLLDLRMGCLDAARERIAALVEVFASHADGELVDRAAAATAELGSLARCESAELLTAAVAPPEDSAARAQASRVATQLARVEALDVAGRYAKGKELAAEAVACARAIGYAPSLAAAMLRLGMLEDRAGDYEQALATLTAALPVAAQARQPALVAELWIAMAFVDGVQLRRVDRALALEQPASVAIELAGGDRRLRAKLSDRIGSIYLYAGDLERARDRMRAALTDREQTEGTTALELAEGANNLAAVLTAMGDLAEAEAYFERALPVYERELGPNHPRTGSVFYNLGAAYTERGDQDRAASAVARALAIEEASLGPRHPDLAPTLGLLGRIALRQGRSADAVELIGRALAIIETQLGPEDRYAVTAHEELAEALAREGRVADAEAHLRRALTVAEASPEIGDRRAARLMFRMADLIAARGDYATALRQYRRGAERSGEPDASWVVVGTAECALRRGRTPDPGALAVALEELGDQLRDAELRGRAGLALARIARRRGQTVRIAELAARAAHDLERAGDYRQAELARGLLEPLPRARAAEPATTSAGAAAAGSSRSR